MTLRLCECETVLLLAPEIINCVLWTFRYVSEVLRQGSFGRVVDTRVGLGIIFSLVAYAVMGAIGLATLGFIVWRLVKGVRIAKGLLGLSNRSRRTAIVTNLVHVTFIVAALFFCNYCNLPNRSRATNRHGIETARKPCTESNSRRTVQAR